MKHKIVITESQYKTLMSNLKEQKNDNFDLSLQFGMNKAPKWLSKIIGNKEDGYTVTLPPSKDDAMVSEIFNGQDYNTYLTKESIKKIKSIISRGQSDVPYLIKYNPKYLAAIIKLYEDSGEVFKSLVIGRETTTTVTKPEPKPTGLPVKTGGTESFPLDGTGKQYFEDNEWVLNDNFKKDFKSQVLDKLIEKKSQGINENLSTLTIDTSCSRLRNGIPQNSPGAEKWKSKKKRITFPELSEQRNNAAKNYVLQELKNLGVNIENVKINQTTKGANGDGTSGPDYTGVNRIDFDKYKFLNINLSFDTNTGGKLVIDPNKKKPVIDKSYDYDFTATLTSPDVPYRIPGFKLVPIWNPKTKTLCKRGPNDQLKCTQPGGTDDWSTDKESDLYWGKKPN